MAETVTVFRPYPLQAGQKIRIDGGRRQGDWQVVDSDDSKVTLRCPVSGREFTWDRFCYWVSEEQGAVWPKEP